MINTKYPPVVVVDENDNEIGTAMLAEVWQKGLYHRIVAVFVLDDTGRMLLQLRGPHVKVYANHWDQAVGGHVDEGQSYKQAAEAELSEELGLQNVTLTPVATHRTNTQDETRIINQFARVYMARIPHDTELKPDETEVSKLQWFTPDELKALITQQPESFRPGLLYGLREFFPKFWPE
jgi:isopentenyl-diphosphate Delta-isomerase